MPAAISEEIKEKAKVIAIQVGYREAARQLDISPNTILSWAHREGWEDQVQAAKAAIVTKNEAQGMQSAAIKSSVDVLVGVGSKSKLLGAKVGHGMLKAISKRKDMELIALAQPFATTVGALSKIHQWDQPSQTNVQVNLHLTNRDFPEVPK